MKAIYFFCFFILSSCFREPQASNEELLKVDDGSSKIDISYSNNHTNPHKGSDMSNDDVNNTHVRVFITYGSDHYHFFTPTVLQMKELKKGNTIRVNSGEANGHFHVLTIDFIPIL